MLSVGQSCSELSGPCSPPHRVRSPTPSADRTIAGPATVRWRPGPEAPLPPAPRTTSSWLRSKERTSRLVRAVAQGGALAGRSNGAWASCRDWNWRAGSKSSVWGRGAPAWPCSHQHHCSSFPGTSDPKEDGLDAQISRLAGLIGRLENKVGPPSPHIHPSIPPSPSQPTREGGIRPEFTRGKSGNLNAPGQGWGVVWTKGRPWEHGLCTCMGPGEEEL